MTPEMKRNTVLMAPVADHSNFDIASFLKVTKSFVLKVWNKLKGSSRDEQFFALRHIVRSQTM